MYKQYTSILREFNALPNLVSNENIFDIAGYPHYENVVSNILAFYLNPNNEHGLSNLFLSALMSFTNVDLMTQENIQINREVYTHKGGRIDLLIETDNQLIGIENKIFHILANDLSDYANSVDKWAQPNQLETIKIILGLRREDESNGFISITYKELFSKIREDLDDYLTDPTSKWVIYIEDFISSIENLYGEKMELDKNDKFFIENEKLINQLINTRNKFITKLNKRVIELSKIIEQPKHCEKQWIYSKCCLVHDFILSGHSIALDLTISPKGWSLDILGRSKPSRDYLAHLINQPSLSDEKIKFEKTRYKLEYFDLETQLDDIKLSLLKWVDALLQADKNL